jgi:hypothetical protein
MTQITGKRDRYSSQRVADTYTPALQAYIGCRGGGRPSGGRGSGWGNPFSSLYRSLTYIASLILPPPLLPSRTTSPSHRILSVIPDAPRSLKPSTWHRFLTYAPRCGRACHSPASAYTDSDILAGRLSAALRLRSHRSQLPIRLVCARVGHVYPTLLPFLSSLHVLKPSSSPYLPLPFSISTLTCSCPPLVTKPPRNHLPPRKLPVPRRTSGRRTSGRRTALLCCSHRRERYPAGQGAPKIRNFLI